MDIAVLKGVLLLSCTSLLGGTGYCYFGLCGVFGFPDSGCICHYSQCLICFRTLQSILDYEFDHLHKPLTSIGVHRQNVCRRKTCSDIRKRSKLLLLYLIKEPFFDFVARIEIIDEKAINFPICQV